MEKIGAWISDYGAQISIIIPLITLSGSTVAYIIKLFLDLADRRQRQFLDLVGLLDQPGTLAGKLAAVYQLSRYRRRADREFLIRFFDNRDTIISGTSADVLKDEMRIAAQKLKCR